MAELVEHQHRELEPRIAPLVQALEQTGFVRVVASCEGHFGVRDPEEISDRSRAIVLFEPAEVVTEGDLVDLFGRIYGDYIEAGAHWSAMISIRKRYVPDLKSLGKIDDVVYELELQPFDVNVSDDEKRRVTDIGIQAAANAATNYRRPS